MTNRSTTSLADRFLCWWGRSILRFPWLLLLLITLLCGLSLQYTVDNLGVNTDTSELLSPDLPFQKNRFRWEKAFPQDAGTILFVVEAPTPEQAAMAAKQLAILLKQQDQLFNYVYIPGINPFFSQQGLLYLDVDKLDELAAKLTDAQPFIGHLAENYHFQGLLEILAKALQNQDVELSMDLDPLLKAIDKALTAVQQGNNRPLSWQELLAIDPAPAGQPFRHIVSARPTVDFNQLAPAEQALTSARECADLVQAQTSGVNIRITGEKALEQEEMETLANDTSKAGILSLSLVCLLLLLALRSVKLVFATFTALIMGLVLTAGYAALVVGHLNVLSVAFAVLYIGLGVDFAIHICLRYRECREQHESNSSAIKESLRNLGPSLFLCAITTSVGFFAFIPTDYAGVSELGIISGGGMFIGLLVSFSVLPALLNILRVKNTQQFRKSRIAAIFCTFPFRYALAIRIISVLLAIAASFLLSHLSFDSDPVNLRNPRSESVLAFKDLLQSNTDSPYALIALADNKENAQQQATAFKQLPGVSKTISLQSFVAEHQQQKLAIIDDLNLVMSTDLNRFNRPIETSDTRQALLKFHQQLAEALTAKVANATAEVLQNLQVNIQNFLQFSEAGPDSELIYERLDSTVFGLLPYTMQQLGISLTAYPFTLSELPDYIKRNWLSADGIYKIMIDPNQDLRSAANLRRFVAEVQTIDPAVTGLSVGDIESGKVVVKAFIQAFSGALIVIIILLLLILRNVGSMLLVIGPLLLAGLLTGASNVLLNNPFNYANIIALPLLMGMGVDSGIHIMHRLNFGLREGEMLLQTSTARGVFFSSLTTMSSFTILAFTSHAGIASMGLLLAVGITFTLLCTLIVLPAFSGKNPLC